MNVQKESTLKENVNRFDDDVQKSGSYLYTVEKLSSRYANARISDAIAGCYSFRGKSVLDIGCGDGSYTLEFSSLAVTHVLGVDPAARAVESANRKSQELGLGHVATFEVGNIYDLKELLGDRRFDCIVVRGVLHHLPDPARAMQSLAGLSDTVIILEPNGYNPVLKLLERFSSYHIEHEERSFFPATLKKWCEAAGLQVQSVELFNLVPFFCPDWMAKLCRSLEPIVERIPLLRQLSCGQSLIVAVNR